MSPQSVAVEKYNYRVTLAHEILRVIILPPTLVHFSLSFLNAQLSWLAHGFVLLLSIPAIYILRCYWTNFINEREAARRGAVLVPVVRGSWPGNIDLLNKMSYWSKTRYPGYIWSKWSSETGSSTINMRTMGMDMIVTLEPAVVKYMLTTGFEKFDKGNTQKERMETFLGNGIFNRDGQLWKMHRAMTRPFFARERVSDFAIFERHTAKALNVFNEVATSSTPVMDVQDLFTRLSIDAAAEFLFGQQLHTLNAPRPIPGQATSGPKGSNVPEFGDGDGFADFVRAFEKMQILISQRFRRGMVWKLPEAIHDATVEPSKVIKDYLTPIVRQAVEEQRQHEKDGMDGEETLLKHLVQSSDDVEMIRDELLNILLAGRDTTSALLSFVLYCLALHPEVEARLRTEINRCCGGSEATYESIKEMRFMRAVLNETLRLFPPVPGNIRETGPEGVVIPSESSDKPYYIPPHTMIGYSPFAIQKRKVLWGKDAEEFKPDRWMDADKVAKYMTDFLFMPFNLGPRICLGQQFAYTEVSYILSSLIPRFTFSLASEYQPQGSLPPDSWRVPISRSDDGIRCGRELTEQIWVRSAVTLYSVGGMWMKVQKL